MKKANVVFGFVLWSSLAFGQEMLKYYGEENKLWGFKDVSGNTIVEPKYEFVEDGYEGIAAFRMNQKWGYVTADGKEVIPPEFDRAGTFGDGLALVGIAANDWFINTKGQKVFELPENMEGNRFSEGLAAVMEFETGEWGFIDKTGKLVIPYTFAGIYQGSERNQDQHVFGFSEGLCAVYRYVKAGFIDKAGTVVIPFKFAEARAFSDGLALAAIEDDPDPDNLDYDPNYPDLLYGYLNKTGEWAVEPKFYDAGSFSEGMAFFTTDQLYGYIDTNGKEVIPQQFEYAGPFRGGKAKVRLNGNIQYINTKGEILQ
ncbi:MAG: WG repeat-containing protein [Flavobacteriales bacterium]|nr:WG repeat-containing protein [Flavobacteriales bacterium]